MVISVCVFFRARDGEQDPRPQTRASEDEPISAAREGRTYSGRKLKEEGKGGIIILKHQCLTCIKKLECVVTVVQ